MVLSLHYGCELQLWGTRSQGLGLQRPVVQQRKHGQLYMYNSSVTDTLGTSVGSSLIHLVLYC